MPPRFFVDLPLAAGLDLELPPGPARHVQVLRMQPGQALTLFDGRGGEWQAEVREMGRSTVHVTLLGHDPVERELGLPVELAAVMPANERFDWLVEKATELGVAAILPLVGERSVLRLNGERAERKRQHWQGIAQAAAEQSGRTRVPRIAPVTALLDLAAQPDGAPLQTWLLSLAEARPLHERLADWQAIAQPRPRLRLLSGPEGGFSPREEAALRAAGALPTSLGARVLRAETAPLAVLAHLGLDTPEVGG